jgi:hypothetical protein
MSCWKTAELLDRQSRLAASWYLVENKNVGIIKHPGICMDVLLNTTDNFTVTRVSGLSCDQMTGLEKRNHQLLFAVCDGELLRHINHRRSSVCAVNPTPVCAIRTTEVEFPDVAMWLIPFPVFIHSWCLVGSMTALGSFNALLCSLLMSLCACVCVEGVEGWRWEWEWSL